MRKKAKEQPHAGGHAELPENIGVYAASVRFDRPGRWQVKVTPVASNQEAGTAAIAFDVLPRNNVPIPGEPAPRSEIEPVLEALSA